MSTRGEDDQIWDEFLAKWPIEKLGVMTLNEYTHEGNKDTFTYWIEHRTSQLGGIGGGSSFKFGVYNRADAAEKENARGRIFEGNYAWYEKYGKTRDEAFDNVRSLIVQLARAARSGDWKTVDSIDLGLGYKWKLAFLYQDKASPQIIPVYNPDVLCAYIDIPLKRENLSDVYLQIVNRNDYTSITELGKEVWKRGKAILDKKAGVIQPNEVESYLEERYGFRVDPSKYVAAFELDNGKQLALMRTRNTPSFFIEDDPDGVVAVEMKRFYHADKSRSSNLKSQTPNLNLGHPAYYVEVKTRQGLDNLLGWYEGKAAQSGKSESKEHEALPMDTNRNVLNQILYGPPGTGKTYNTVNKALAIIDPEFLATNIDNRTLIKQRFDELKEQGQIGFVTFHQSFSYEDFVEGLKATSNDETNNIEYIVEEGIFKKMCDAAASKVTAGSRKSLSLEGRHIWKMSLGNTLEDDEDIYEECINNEYALLGWGGDIDFTGCDSKKDVLARFQKAEHDTQIGDYKVTAVFTYLKLVRPDDLIIVSDGNSKFRAIGRVKGDYYLLDEERTGYRQCRDVEWLRVYSPSRPREELFKKNLNQKTLYELRSHNIKLDVLEKLLESAEPEQDNKPYVLIIDEINRGNTSRIFGELITLIEPDKRTGMPEALEVMLPYSKKPFSVPDNLYIIGTMNTADRSLALMDTALRRRFHFEEMMPDTDLLNGIDVEGINIKTMLDTMNQRIEVLYDREHTLGHSFFLPLRSKPNIDLLAEIFERQVIPLLEEYFFEDWEKIRLVLGDNRKPQHLAFVSEKYNESMLSGLLGDDYSNHASSSSYERNQDALNEPDAYINIYQSTGTGND